jgi:type I restriction enzyme R subunit
LAGLAEKGFGAEQLEEMQAIIDAEKSDLFDVLAHVAFARAPIERKIRADQARGAIRSEFSAKQQEFLDFVLGQYVAVGVGELSTEKLAPLLNLKYQHSIRDAVSDLGTPDSIAAAFSGFQRHLYNASAA